MKKALITIGAVAAFTLIFLFAFHYISGAQSVSLDSAEYSTVLTDDSLVGGDMQNDELKLSEDLYENENTATDEITGGKTTGEGAESLENSEDELLTPDLAAEVKEYIKERIIPVVVGVLTSLSAVLATLGAIKKSLARLSSARDDFKNEASERKNEFERQSELLNRKSEELSELAKLIPQLEGELLELKAAQEKLNAEAYNIGKMISLGFSGSQAVIRSGNGRKISALLCECRALSGKTDENDSDELKDKEPPEAETENKIKAKQSTRKKQSGSAEVDENEKN